MQHQAAVGHFEFLGLDIIADQSGGVWLMEGKEQYLFKNSPPLLGVRSHDGGSMSLNWDFI